MESPAPSDFIRDIVADDLATGRCAAVHTRFPPEPNGYLHIGHAKSICLNFGIAREVGGICNLRMDDTNPAKEEVEYVDSIVEDVRWLVDGWADDRLGLKPPGATPARSAAALHRLDPALPGSPGEPFHASDYFESLHAFAIQLIEKGSAFVCDLSPEETDRTRGAPDRPGIESPFRNRTVAENLDLFGRMRAGEFPDGARTLRAKIDMAAPNVWLRDPILYRIRHTEHHQTGAAWCIYPTYDFAHCLSDYIEGITHSICTLEFEVHRPLYDWVLETLDLPGPRPRQIEFARLNLSYTIMSKRKLLELVRDGHVSGWDDPRLPTLSGFRRRGVPASALRAFAYHVGITKYNGLTDVAVLEHAIREVLNHTAPRRMAVLHPVRVVLTNLPEDFSLTLSAVNNPEDPGAGTRPLQIGRELFIDADDFSEDPPPKFFRLRPGGEVRLKYAFLIRCDTVLRNPDGSISEIRCTADLDSRTGGLNAGRKVKGTLHWVDATGAVDAEVRLYDRLFSVPEPDADGDFLRHLNPASLTAVPAKCEPALADGTPGFCCQFERLGYFAVDPDSRPGNLVINRVLPLRDTWTKAAGKV